MSICTVQITLPPCEDYVTARCCLPMAPACQPEQVIASYPNPRPQEQYCCRVCKYCCRVCRQFPIRDFSRFRYFYVYHRGVNYFKSPWDCTLVIKFGIAVKYTDCRGNKKGHFFEDSVQITGLERDFNLSASRIRLTDLICGADDPALITARFQVTIQAG